jgi:hypothetical protein
VTSAPQITELESFVDDGLSKLISAGRADLVDLERRRAGIDREISALARRLRTWESAQRSLVGRTGHLRLASDQLPTKREAVLALLGESPESEMKLVEIRHALISRGWMTEDHSSSHALEVAVIGMAKRGELRRVRKGYYVLSGSTETRHLPA